MAPTIVPAPADRDPRVIELLDRAFERPDQESRLAARLAAEHPDTDPELSLLALDDDGEPLGWAMFLPRELRLRNAWVRSAICAPFVVLPGERSRGVGRALLERGRALCVERGLRCGVVLGGRPFFARSGFAPAFQLHALRVRTEDLPAPATDGWRALSAGDLEHLGAMLADSYRGSPGCERRPPSALDWESAIPTGHCHVLERDGRPAAHLRFRTDGGFSIRECSAADTAAVDALLGYLRHLAEAHQVDSLDVHAPPTHRVARALFHGGALRCTSAFGDEAQLGIFDWSGLVADTADSWRQAVELADGELSVHIDGQTMALRADTLDRTPGIDGRLHQHLWAPPGWGGSLITGHRSWRDLVDCPQVRRESNLNSDGWEAVRALFPPADPCWPYGPAFEIADT